MGKFCTIAKVVEYCLDCPHFELGDDWEPFNVCGHSDFKFPHDFDETRFIYDDCPLPDAEEDKKA